MLLEALTSSCLLCCNLCIIGCNEIARENIERQLRGRFPFNNNTPPPPPAILRLFNYVPTQINIPSDHPVRVIEDAVLGPLPNNNRSQDEVSRSPSPDMSPSPSINSSLPLIAEMDHSRN